MHVENCRRTDEIALEQESKLDASKTKSTEKNISKESVEELGPYFLGPLMFIVMADRARAARSRGGASVMSSYLTPLINSVYLSIELLKPRMIAHPSGL